MGLNPTQSFLHALGLSPQESAIYLALIQHGISSTLQLSRATGLPRTSIYRYIENLKELGLIEEIIDEHRKLAKAADPTRLELLVARQKEKAKTLESLFPEVENLLRPQIDQRQPGTTVLFYRGKGGLEQQVWNELRATGEILGYTLLAFEDIIGKKLAQKYREERMLRHIKTREILADDDKYLTSETLKYARHTNLFENYDWRYLPKEKIQITHNLIIYDDTVSFYNWYQGPGPELVEREIFGVEIHNPTIAAMQKQIFEILWNLAEIPETTLQKRLSKK